MQKREDNSFIIQNSTIPILMVIGKKDPVLDFEIAKREISLADNSVVQILENCGHMGVFEQKKNVFKMTKSFINYCY